MKTNVFATSQARYLPESYKQFDCSSGFAFLVFYERLNGGTVNCNGNLAKQ